MLSLLQATRLRGGAGEKLPDVWRVLANNNIHIRRGQLHLISAGPGAGKSALALAYAIKVGVPSLYLSMDGDAYTVATRSAQMLTGWEAEKAEAALEDEEFRARTLEAVSHIRFSFRSGVDTTELMMSVAAYAEAYGAYPHLIIVDNLANIAFDGDEFASLRRIIADLHQLSRLTQSAVVALHHVTGSYDDGMVPVPLSGLQGKISKMPELILTLSRGTREDQLFVSPVKNRHGKADPSGLWKLELSAVLSNMAIADRAVAAAA